MTELYATGVMPRSRLNSWWFAWAALLALTAIVFFYKTDLAWAFKYPRAWNLPLRFWISDFMKWLINDLDFGLFTFKEFTRAISWLVDQPYQFARSLFATGFVRGYGQDAEMLFPRLSWLGLTAVAVMMGCYAKNLKLGIVAGFCFAYLTIFGQWDSAMVTLSSIVIAVPFGIIGGLALGIAGYRSRRFELFLTPVLDLMQTVPIFAYLVPILMLFGFGPVAAMIATIIYAMPPMVRITMLALRQVPVEILEYGRMAGCTKNQLLWRVQLPAAVSSLMVGVNQVVMLSLNMVIIASNGLVRVVLDLMF